MQIHCDQDGEPEHVDAHGFCHWRKNRHDDEGNLHEIDEETQYQNHHHGQNDEAPLFTGQLKQPFFQQVVATGVAEYHGEGRGADQDREDHGGHLHGILGCIPHHFERELPVDDGQNHGANATQGG